MKDIQLPDGIDWKQCGYEIRQYGVAIGFSQSPDDDSKYLFRQGDEVFHITAEDILEMATWANSVGMLAKDACRLWGLGHSPAQD